MLLVTILLLLFLTIKHLASLAPKMSMARIKRKQMRFVKNTIQNNLFSYFKIHTLGSIKMIVDPGRFEVYSFFGLPTENDSLTEQFLGGRYLQAINHLKNGGWIVVLFLVLLGLSLLKVAGFLFSITTIRKTWPLFIIVGLFYGNYWACWCGTIILAYVCYIFNNQCFGVRKNPIFFPKTS